MPTNRNGNVADDDDDGAGVESREFAHDDPPYNRRATDGPYLTPSRIAEDLDVSMATVQRWIRNGHLRVIRLGPKLYRIRQADFQAFLDAGGVPPETKGDGDE